MAETPRKELDAIELLMQDHREVESLFREFEYLQQNDRDAGRLVEAACTELKVHDALKTELFCPALVDASKGEGLEGMLAGVEDAHRTMRDLIELVEQTDTDEAKRDAHFVVLAEHVERHFEEAETRVFPRAKQLKRLDLLSIAGRMKERKSELMAAI
jgi:hypothetical protein